MRDVEIPFEVGIATDGSRNGGDNVRRWPEPVGTVGAGMRVLRGELRVVHVSAEVFVNRVDVAFKAIRRELATERRHRSHSVIGFQSWRLTLTFPVASGAILNQASRLVASAATMLSATSQTSWRSMTNVSGSPLVSI